MRKPVEEIVPALEGIEAAVRKERLSVRDLEAALHLDRAILVIGGVLNEIESLTGALPEQHASSIETAARHLSGIHAPDEASNAARRLSEELRSLL